MFFLLVFIACSFISSSEGWWLWEETKTCDPRYHFWEPFHDCVPSKAYVASLDRYGKKLYIGRVVDPVDRTWTAPSAFLEDSMYIWEHKEKDIPLTEKYLEILSIHKPSPGFGWRPTSKFEMNDLEKDCCLVDAGSGFKDGSRISSWIGRGLYKGRIYIGAVYPPKFLLIWPSHPFVYVDENGNTDGMSFSFEILAYDCCTKAWCRQANKADCCYDIMT